jgi:tRNA(Ile2) C34 agmatinyltransferase TiaS
VLEEQPKEEKDFICPECKEKMQKKEGKEYYKCKKHWGYPAMIEKGEVREKNYTAKQVTK